MATGTDVRSEARTTALRFLPVAVIVAALLVAYGLGLGKYLSLDAFLESREALKRLVAAHTVLAALAFAVGYALMVAVAFPAAALVTVAGGFLFGWLLGGILTVIGATIGAAVIFLAARTAFSDVLRRRAGGAVQRFAEGFRHDAFAYLLVLRLTPVLPFFAVNIAPAFFGIALSTFVASTFLGIIPGTMVYAFLGSGLDQALARADASDFALTDLVTLPMTAALFGLCALAVLGLVLKKTFLRRRAADALARQGAGRG